MTIKLNFIYLVGSPAKRNATEIDNRHVEVKKVRMGSGGALSEASVTITERRSKSLGSPDGTVMNSNILLVDMNDEGTPNMMENQIVDRSGSPPASSVEKEAEIELTNTKLEAKVGATTSKIVKRLTRAVNTFYLVLCEHFKLKMILFRNWNVW